MLKYNQISKMDYIVINYSAHIRRETLFSEMTVNRSFQRTYKPAKRKHIQKKSAKTVCILYLQNLAAMKKVTGYLILTDILHLTCF
jgi:hypothetical protein